MHIILEIAGLLDFESLKVGVRHDLLGRDDLRGSQRKHHAVLIDERYD